MRGRWMRHVVRRGIATASVGLLFSLLASVALAQPTPGTAEIKSVIGRAEVLRKGQTQWAPAVVGIRLGEGDDIRTYAGAQAELELPDTSTLAIAENSRLQLTKLEFDRQKQSRLVLAHLAVGKVRAVIAQAAITLVRSRQSNFAISTPTAVAAARGTTTWVAFNPALKATAMAVEHVALQRKGLIDCIPLNQPTSATMVTEGYSTEDCGPPFLTPPAFLSFTNPLAPGALFSGIVTVPSVVFQIISGPPPAGPSITTGPANPNPSSIGQDVGQPKQPCPSDPCP